MLIQPWAGKDRGGKKSKLDFYLTSEDKMSMGVAYALDMKRAVEEYLA